MESMDYWRLCDDLSINEAAHLLIGIDPNELEAQEAADRFLAPSSHAKYIMDLSAATRAISCGLRRGVIKGVAVWSGVRLDESIPIGPDDSVDADKSSVEVDSLRHWLISRGIRTGFFFPDGTEAPDYLDPTNPRYAPKLAAAVCAWQSVTDSGGKSPKQALTKWLRENAALFGMADDDGMPIKQAIDEVAKVANWNHSGGAPKTPSE